jgi:hypothetical protein
MEGKMLDRVVAATSIHLPFEWWKDLPRGWRFSGSVGVSEKTELWGKFEYLTPRHALDRERSFAVRIIPKSSEIVVLVTLPRLLWGDNWHVLAEADVALACAHVDERLRQCLGVVASGLPPFAEWPVRAAEYPHDVDFQSHGAVQRWIGALSGMARKGMRVNDGLPRPHLDRHGWQTGLAWGGRKSQRTIKVYDKARQCGDDRCPPELLRIETKIQDREAWDSYLPSAMRTGERRMTVAEAGTVRVAAMVLESTHDKLRLDMMQQAGERNPFAVLVRHHRRKSAARTLAGFHAFAILHGERAGREVYGPRMVRKHRGGLAEAGIPLALADESSPLEAVIDLPAIPRPTAALLAERPTFAEMDSLVA